jgi:hypothetical protein
MSSKAHVSQLYYLLSVINNVIRTRRTLELCFMFHFFPSLEQKM